MHFGPLGHQGHNIGLGDGLALPDGQGVIAVGLGGHGPGHEAVPGHRAHGDQHPGVGDVPALQLPGHHGLPGVLETIQGPGGAGAHPETGQEHDPGQERHATNPVILFIDVISEPENRLMPRVDAFSQ